MQRCNTVLSFHVANARVSVKFVRFLAGLAVAIVAAKSGRACSCIGPTPVCSVYWSTPVLFLGTVNHIEHTYNEPPEEKTVDGKKIEIIGPGEYVVHFVITKSYRGDGKPSTEISVHTADQGSACGFAFEEGRSYLVFAAPAGPEGHLYANHCSRTHEVISVEQDPDIQWIETLSKAPPGGSIFGSIQSLSPNLDGGYDRSPVQGVAVSIGGKQSRTLVTDSQGKFRADGVAPGKYVVSAQAPAQHSRIAPVTVTVQDRSCAEIPWFTRLDGHIRGHVYFSDGTPASGLYLTLKSADFDPHNPATWQSSSITSGADGLFDFAQLSPGSYVLAVNMDFPAVDGKYYRSAFFPGGANRSEAAVISLDRGEQVDHLRFFLPPDSASPSVSLQVKVIGQDGKPAANASVLAYDEIWQTTSPSPLYATAGKGGEASLDLRPTSTYLVEAFVNLPDFSQACAEPIEVSGQNPPSSLVLQIAHPVGNCLPYAQRRGY
ncbi:MAG: carboxypeptidase regulatory-like domain-containing protein [Acidobacteriaceae bacterium]|nr:carboxypeptidase regulatory-like domain-containing protein [Acidobacteriaceae bacterium]